MDQEQARTAFNIILGEHIAFKRKQKGLTQEDLGALCNKDKQSINRLEKGHVSPTCFYLLQLAVALDTTLNELIDFEIPENIPLALKH